MIQRKNINTRKNKLKEYIRHIHAKRSSLSIATTLRETKSQRSFPTTAEELTSWRQQFHDGNHFAQVQRTIRFAVATLVPDVNFRIEQTIFL